jgi:hypothetical protein
MRLVTVPMLLMLPAEAFRYQLRDGETPQSLGPVTKHLFGRVVAVEDQTLRVHDQDAVARVLEHRGRDLVQQALSPVGNRVANGSGVTHDAMADMSTFGGRNVNQ